jgi:signal transduction histidine kinase
MWVGLWEGCTLMARHWAWPGVAACLVGTVWLKSRKQWLQEGAQRRIVRAREELEAYAALDVRIPQDGDMGALALRVCRVVKEKSAFHRAAMLMREPDGRVKIAGSIGMEDQTLGALRLWGEQVGEAERRGGAGCSRGDGGLGTRVGANSFAVVLGKGPVAAGCGRAIVIPLWTTGGHVVGALVVCADGLLSVRRSSVVEAMTALEGLAAKLSRSMENAALAERLLRAEKLAGLGLLAGGVAHALNNPLTAVLGFADLIVHTSAETRVQADAKRIVQEARRMREMIESLANCWHPAYMDEEVQFPALLRELADECAARLEERGVRLLLEEAENLPPIRGNRERLRQIIEQLLTNAAQAVAAAQKMGVESPLGDEEDRQHTIRVAVNCDERMLHLIVSDTGTGFREPARVFDPFYAASPGEGAGMGLSFCYGIVREHGGEISVFNLHPHGAAVVVDLPIDQVSAQATGIVPNVA